MEDMINQCLKRSLLRLSETLYCTEITPKELCLGSFLYLGSVEFGNENIGWIFHKATLTVVKYVHYILNGYCNKLSGSDALITDKICIINQKVSLYTQL